MVKDLNIEKNVATLETLLREQLAAHERLLAVLKQKKVALAKADHAEVTDCCRRENEQIQAVSELEKKRLMVVGELTLQIEPKAAQPMRLPELAQQLAEPMRGRLLVLRQQVRERMEQVRAEVTVARRATEALVGHIQGLVQMVGGAVTGVATYNRAGSRPRAATAISTFTATA